jgi:hypothetical protein
MVLVLVVVAAAHLRHPLPQLQELSYYTVLEELISGLVYIMVLAGLVYLVLVHLVVLVVQLSPWENKACLTGVLHVRGSYRHH